MLGRLFKRPSVMIWLILFFTHSFVVLNKDFSVPIPWRLKSMLGIRNQLDHDHHAVDSIMRGGETYNQGCSMKYFGFISLINTG